MSLPNQPLGFCNDQMVPITEIAVPGLDVGLTHGTIVAEQIRTIQGKAFLLDRHFDRWQRGLELLKLPAPLSLSELGLRVAQLVALNSKLLEDTTEQGICFFSTPGVNNFGWNDLLVQASSPSFFCYTYPLNKTAHREIYQRGIHLVTTPIADVSSHCWPKSVKIRSRLHYYLAQQYATEQCPDAKPILLDDEGWVSDSATASIVGWSESEGLIVRPKADRYASISVCFLVELCEKIGIKVNERLFSVEELKRFDEVFLASTPWCLCPVRQIDDERLAAVQDGFRMFHKLMHAWEDAAGGSILA